MKVIIGVIPHHTHPISDVEGLEPRLDALERHRAHPRHPLHRDHGHTHDMPDSLAEGFDGKGSGHPGLDHVDLDNHPGSHGPMGSYQFAANRAPAFGEKKSTMKGNSADTKGSREYTDG
jgi:hypothetical protein